MKYLKRGYFIFFLISFSVVAQEEHWFYLKANDTLFNPEFQQKETELVYTGANANFKSTLANYKIKTFKKTQKHAKKEFLKRTFFVIADNPNLLNDLLTKHEELFVSGALIPKEDQKIFEPNDYGLTSTIGSNKGLPVRLDYLDFLGVPKAWYYTTGSPDVFIGISDGEVAIDNPEFKNKTTVLQKSSLSKGHGSGVAANAAAQGNNGYGIPGICYDCNIQSTTYGNFGKYDQLKELSRKGTKVINCSWVGSKSNIGQQNIDSIFNNGTVIVAASGNRGWDEFPGTKKYYPASYDNVISVGSVQFRYENVLDNINYSKRNGKPYFSEIRGHVGRTGGFNNDDIYSTPSIYPVSTATLNDEVDILAPTVGLFRFSKFLLENRIEMSQFSTTSGAAPLVTGTVGLMFSLNPCLPHDEVESILKITATNIDDIEVNKRFAGNYGAGMLNTAKAIQLVHDLYTENATAHINNQNFSRWDFKITALSKKVLMEKQTFRDKATLHITAKNQIVLGEGTHLKPNQEGQINLKINPTLEKQCDLRYRDASVVGKKL